MAYICDLHVEGSISINIWAALIFFGAIQGILLSTVLWNRGSKNHANRTLSLLVLSLAIHLIEYGLCVSGLILRWPHLLFTTYPTFFVIGPLFYLYVRTYLGYKMPSQTVILLHGLPSILFIGIMLPFYTLSADQKLSYFLQFASTEFKQIPDSQFVIMYLQILQILIYLYFSRRLLNEAAQGLTRRNKNGNRTKVKWLNRAVNVFTAFVILFGIVTTILVLYSSHRIEFDYVVVLCLACILYAVGYQAIREPRIFNETLTLNHQKAHAHYTNPLQSTLRRYMDEHRPYLNEHLKLEDLAFAIGTPPHNLSELINKSYGCGFFEFVNRHRVDAAKKLLADNKHVDKKILAIAFESGFNTKATFNRVFKEYTGFTPSAYRANHLSLDD